MNRRGIPSLFHAGRNSRSPHFPVGKHCDPIRQLPDVAIERFACGRQPAYPEVLFGSCEVAAATPCPKRGRWSSIGSHGIAKEDFELFSIAVSAMNGCGMCIESHERVLLQHGVKSETIQSAVRIAAVLKAGATVHATL